MTAADHANTVRHALEWMANYNMTGTERTLHIDMQGKAREVLPALDALQAQAEAAYQALSSSQTALAEEHKRAEAAEADRDAAVREIEHIRAHLPAATESKNQAIRERDAAEAERDRLADALRDMLAKAMTRRTGIHADGTETWAVPLAGELAAIARAALAHTEQPARTKTLGPDPDREPHPTPRNLWKQP